MVFLPRINWYFNGIKNDAIYYGAAAGQVIALILHIVLLEEIKKDCSESSSQSSRDHVTAAIILNSIGLFLCIAWVMLRKYDAKGFLSFLNRPLSIWVIKISCISMLAIAYLFSASLYGLTINLQDSCTALDNGVSLSLSAVLAFTAGLALGHMGEKSHKYARLSTNEETQFDGDLRPPKLTRIQRATTADIDNKEELLNNNWDNLRF